MSATIASARITFNPISFPRIGARLGDDTGRRTPIRRSSSADVLEVDGRTADGGDERGWSRAIAMTGRQGGLDLVSVRVRRRPGLPAGCLLGVVARFAEGLTVRRARGPRRLAV